MAILIGKQPTGGTIYRGGSKTLSCSATSDRGSSLGYTWYRAGSRFGSGSSISANNSYVGTFAYFCRIVEYDTGATRDTNTVYVTVNATPVPVLDDANGVYDINAYKGDSITFSAASTVEKGTLTYLWERGMTISSWEQVGTASTYSPPTTALVTYLYRCTVTNTLNGYTATKMTNVGQVSISDTPTPTFTTGTDISDATYYLGTAADQLLGIVGIKKGTVTYQWQQSNNNSTWVNISGATTRSYTPPTSSVGTTYYRLVATNTLNGYTKSATSSVAAITVAGAPVPVLNNPNGVFEANYYRGESAAAFDATATSAAGTISYQWQRSLTAASWENVATTATYTPPTSTVVTYLYRCVVTNTLGGSTAQKYTSVGQVSISDTPTPSFYSGTDISDATYYRGASASELIGIVGVARGNVTYQWQSSSNGTTFTNISGATTRSYTPGTKVVGTLYYRLVVTNTLYGYTKTLTSDAAKIVVNDTPTPVFDADANLSNASYYRGVGAKALGGAVILNAGTLSAQWQRSSNNSTFSNISGATGRTYTPPTSSVGTMYYRCVLTNTLNGYTKTTTSSSVRIVVNATPSPVLQNSNGVYDVTYYKGATASAFNATATSVSGTITYKWERSLTAATWEQVGTSATYKPPTNSVSAYLYRCTVTNSLGGYTAVVYTNVGQVTVLDTPMPLFVNGTDIANATYFRGAEATPLKAVISIGAGTLTYQWQQSSDGNNFRNISGATNTSYTPPTKVLGDMHYRVVVTNTLNGYTKTVNSSVAKITVKDTPSPTFGPNANMAGTGYYRGASAAALGGEVIVNAGDVTAQWQKSSNGSSYTNISGATSRTYTPPTTTVGTVYYRCVLTNTLNGYTKTTTSSSARIVVNATPTPVIQNPGTITDVSYYIGASATQMNATATVAAGTLTYAWFKTTLASGTNWVQVATTPLYAPSTSEVGEFLYRCEVTNTLNGYTKATQSNVPTIKILSTPVPALAASGVNLQDAVYEQNATSEALSAIGTVDAGTITYQWQRSTDGETYTNIAGETNATFSPPTASVGTTYYRCVLTNTLNGYTKTYTTDAAVITVQNSMYVTIFQQPVSATYYRGSTTTALRCTASSSVGLPMTYAWYNNAGIQVGTGQTYTPSSMRVGSAGYYCVATDSNNSSAQSRTATITVRATPVPELTSAANLQNATYLQGETAESLNASATVARGTITYQWQWDTGNGFANISGATNAQYTPQTTQESAYEYRCVITNTLYGYTASLTTDAAVITVNGYAVPVFVQQPHGGTYDLMQEAEAMVVVLAEEGDYTYQWRESTDALEYTDIDGATRDYYTPSTSVAGKKYYRVTVTNGTGEYAKSATSSTATVVVLMPELVIEKQPESADYLRGAPASPLRVVASAPGANITYQWRKRADGESSYQRIEGAVNQEYTPETSEYGITYYSVIVQAESGLNAIAKVSEAARIWVSDQAPPEFVNPLRSANYEGNEAAAPLDGTARATAATIAYQWYWSQDGIVFHPISGATGAKYTPSTSEEGTKWYYVIATATYQDNTSLFAKSNVAQITVSNVTYTPAMAWQKYLETLKTDFVKLAKLEFLQPDGSVAFTLDNNPLNNRSGAFLQDGVLTVNLQNGKRRTLTVTLANLDGEYEYNVNKVWFGQQIRLSEGLILPNGQEFYLPQGIFYVVNPEEKVNPGSNTVNWTLDDKWAYLDGTLFGNLEGIYEVPVNTNVFTAVESVLALPRGNGYPVDNVQPIFTDYYNDQTTTLADGSTISYVLSPYTARFESDEASYADVVLEMNTMIAGWVGYDQTGRLRMDPSQDDVLDDSKPIQWQFEPTEKQFLGATYTVKNSEVFNDIIITGEGLDDYENVSGRATNFDPASDTNVNLIGRKVKRLSSPGYASDKQCENLAVFKLKRQTVLQKSVSIESAQIFHLQENQLVTIRRPDKAGQPIERHLVTGFTRPIAQTGSMQIEATSVHDFPTATVNALPWEE